MDDHLTTALSTLVSAFSPPLDSDQAAAVAQLLAIVLQPAGTRPPKPRSAAYHRRNG